MGTGITRWTLRSKFIVMLLLFGVLPMLVIGWAGYDASKRTIIQQAVEIQSRLLEQTVASVDSELSMYQMLAGSFGQEESVRQMLDPESSPDDLRRYVKEWDMFNQLLSKLVFSKFEETPSIVIYGYNRKVFTSWGADGTSLADYLDSNTEFRKVLKAASTGRFVWAAPHPVFDLSSAAEPMFTYVAGYTDADTGTELGKMLISGSLTALVEDLASNNRFVIAKPEGSLVYSVPGAAVPEAVLGEAVAASYIKGAAVLNRGESMNKSLYISAKLLNDWVVVKEIPYRSLLSELGEIRNIMLLVIGLCVLLSILLGHWFTGRMLRPIKQMVRVMRRIGSGEWAHLPLIRTDPELDLLQRSFLSMTSDLKELQERMEVEQQQKLELELESLLAQIQPHMIKNTLAVVSGLALRGKTEQIREVVHALGYFLSSKIYPENPLVTIEEDLDALQHYLTIMRIRYPDRIHVLIDVPDALLGQHIPRFTLQPLVENSIYHGMKNDEAIHIWIQAYDISATFTISVADNGAGTAKQPFEAAVEGEDTGRVTAYSGIGLSNIRQRIALYFGGAGTLRFESRPGTGAQVEITLPKRQ
ncbi:histidine kinase [Paenibacillus tritici]|uniref:histidine kinase n=1 Tax=Paenibacillus tritici TaxID=1873425 RepID=A0ABX2DL95_9BACL|nr:histidine kinase [Paenibacillus tritici]NQX45230.1 histidine kinase [Paenibacillus tritici]